MVVRPLIRYLLLLVAGLLLAGTAQACFGPKLYLGTNDDPRSQVLASLVAIYVQEKTGVEVVRQPLAATAPIAAIRADTIDFAFTAVPEDMPILLQIEGVPALVSGSRILEDLQFTTVRPALQRLAGQLTPGQVSTLVAAVDAGGLPMDVARRFLRNAGWI
jgi:glycine betaine/choline ABC-type transport system substrate-binding protein